jgi:uncharacterized protein YecE (DUF72 family)
MLPADAPWGGNADCSDAALQTAEVFHMKRRTSGSISIGISGWRYPPWRGVFYPPDLPQRRELEYASRQFRTIEINGSFYSLQRPENYAAWYESTPKDFVFSVKGGRYITHILRLKKVEKALANFFASGVFNLREKLGPFLWQFPPNFHYREDVFENFFRLLPADAAAAQTLARKRESRMTGRTRLKIEGVPPLRHAIEIRHSSFANAGFIQQLRRHGIALVVADTAGKWPLLEDITADFTYIRLHGDEELYVSGYTDRALDRWAQRIRCWASGRQPDDASLASNVPARTGRARDIYCYFDNDVKIRAPVDARKLMAILGLDRTGESEPVDELFAPPPADLAAFTKAQLASRWKFAGKMPASGVSRRAPKRRP